MIARCDPNVIGSPSLSPLGTAIRRGEEHTVETLLQFRADPHLKEERNERPLIMAIARRATNCVKVLLEYRADPRMTMSVPLAGPHGTRARHKRHAIAMDLAPCLTRYCGVIVSRPEINYNIVRSKYEYNDRVTPLPLAMRLC